MSDAQLTWLPAASSTAGNVWYVGPHARASDPQTSKDAAATVDIPRRCGECLPFLRLTEPTTATDLAERMRLAGVGWAFPGAVSRRLLDLEKRGLAVRDGEKTSATGKSGIAWRAA